MSEYKTKAAQKKKDVVKRIEQLGKQYPIIGVLNMHSLPAAQLANMRGQMRSQVEILLTRKKLIGLALDNLEKSTKGVTALKKHLNGVPALLFTKDNPFALYKTIKKNKSKAAAKPGQLAPYDLVIPAGPTPFTPGPVLSELGALGIKAGVENGKVAIKQDAVVCKEGQPINASLASMLARLSIEPMEIGLDLVAVFEKGTIYPKSVLDIDETKFLADLSTAASWAFNLAIEAAIPNKETAEELVKKAFRDAKAVAIEGNIMADAVVGELLAKAEREMLSVKENTNN